jgi:hypothetical protein
MGELISPDFFEFGRSGRVYHRQETLAVAHQTIDAVFPLPDNRRRSRYDLLFLKEDRLNNSIQEVILK